MPFVVVYMRLLWFESISLTLVHAYSLRRRDERYKSKDTLYNGVVIMRCTSIATRHSYRTILYNVYGFGHAFHDAIQLKACCP